MAANQGRDTPSEKKKMQRESERGGKVELKVQNLNAFGLGPFSNGKCIKTIRLRERVVEILPRGSAKQTSKCEDARRRGLPASDSIFD